MAKTQVQIGMKEKMRKMSPSKPITVFRTTLHSGLYGLTEDKALEDAKGEANIRWSEYENYKWVWENAVANSVTFHAHFDIATCEYRVAVTAKFEPENLTLYYLQFGA
jgi:hypothetical protein